MNTILHLPINKEIKDHAEAVAKKQGYSSLQEVLRVFLSRFARERVQTAFVQTDLVEALNQAEESILTKREQQTRKAIQEGKFYKARTVKEMMTILEDTKSS